MAGISRVCTGSSNSPGIFLIHSLSAADAAHHLVAHCVGVSTIDQDIEKNKAAILDLANSKHLGHVEFIEEKISGKVTWKQRKIASILEKSEKGDNIIVSELSRLGRSLLECMEILSIAMQKGVNIYAIKGN